MDYLLALDHQLFLAINTLPHTGWSDSFAEFLSGIGTFGIVWFMICVVLFFREEKKDHRFFIPIVSVGVGTLLLVEYVIKPIVGRLRPTNIIGAVTVIGANGYSFPSTHAAMSFAMAGVLTAYEPRFCLYWYILATLIAVSRIYLGVHYPIDVCVGALVGILLARVGLSITPHKKMRLRHRTR